MHNDKHTCVARLNINEPTTYRNIRRRLTALDTSSTTHAARRLSGTGYACADGSECFGEGDRCFDDSDCLPIGGGGGGAPKCYDDYGVDCCQGQQAFTQADWSSMCEPYCCLGQCDPTAGTAGIPFGVGETCETCAGLTIDYCTDPNASAGPSSSSTTAPPAGAGSTSG